VAEQPRAATRIQKRSDVKAKNHWERAFISIS